MAFSSSAKAQVWISTVSCKGDPSPRYKTIPKSYKIDINVSVPVANQLAIYVFNGGMLMGPRGWECHSKGGVEGSAIILTPSDTTDRSQAEVYVSTIGDTKVRDAKGRYIGAEESMSAWANTYFPNEMAKETASGYGPQTTITLRRYKTDTITYLPPQSVTITDNIFGNIQTYIYTDLIAEFTTPKGHFGVGSEILFGFGYDLLGYGFMGYQYDGLMPDKYTNSLPIQGYIKLHINPGGSLDHVNLFCISLSNNYSHLLSPILNYANKLYSIF